MTTRAVCVVLLGALLFASSPLRGLKAAQIRERGSVCEVQNSTHRAVSLGRDHRGAAIALLKRLARCPALSQLELFQIGWTYGQLHDFQDALRVFATVHPDVPDLQTHAYAVALGQLQMGDGKGAVATLSALSRTTSLNADSANLLAIAYAKAGDYPQGYGILRDSIQAHPDDLFAWLNLITLLSDAGQLSEARRVAQQCADRFPGRPEPLVELGAAETLLGDLQNARVTFQKAVQLAPRRPDQRFLLALTDYRLGNFAAAESDLAAAAQEGVANADLIYLMAECMIKRDPTKPDAAILVLGKAIAIDRDSVPAHTLRGKLLLESGQARTALQDLELAHTLDPAMRSATYNLARAYFAVGRREKAQELFHLLSTQATSTVDEVSSERLQRALSPQP